MRLIEFLNTVGGSQVMRELVNGFMSIFLFALGYLFARSSWDQYRREGEFTPSAQAAASIALMLWVSLLMRVWIWKFLWEENHGYTEHLRNEWQWSALTGVLMTLIGPWLIYRITPPESGHRPWMLIIVLAWIIPWTVYLMPLALW